MGLNHGLRGFHGWISSLIRVIRAIRGQAFSFECNLQDGLAEAGLPRRNRVE